MANATVKYPCFETPFLTILGDCNDTSTSGLVLNHLHGVTLGNAANIADREFSQGVNMLREFEIEAINAVVRDVLLALSNKYNFKKVRSSDVLGHFETETFASVTGHVGYEVKVSDFSDLGSMIQLENIQISVAEDQLAANIYIEVDGVTQTITKDLLANSKNTIYPDVQAERLLRVFYEPTVDVGQSTVNQVTSLNRGESCDCRYSCSGCFIAKNVDVTEDGSGNVISTALSQQATGLKLSISCVSSPDDMICRYKDELAEVVRLKVGMMMMLELLSSTRQNPLVRNKRDDAERLLARWEGTPDPQTGFDQSSEYWKLLSPIIKMIKADLDMNHGKDYSCTGYKVAEVRM